MSYCSDSMQHGDRSHQPCRHRACDWNRQQHNEKNLFDLSQRFRREAPDRVLFLRAERLADGSRTFKIREGEALPTSHGMDLYDEIFRDGLPAPTAGD